MATLPASVRVRVPLPANRSQVMAGGRSSCMGGVYRLPAAADRSWPPRAFARSSSAVAAGTGR